MKEIKLDIGKGTRLKNEYNLPVKVGRKENGYYVIFDRKGKGPFEKIFVDKSDDGDELIVCYNKEESKTYLIDIYGLTLAKKEKISLEKLCAPKPRKPISFENCELLLSTRDHYIFYNDENDVFFAATYEDESKNISSLKTFKSYDELVEYYRQIEHIDLFNHSVSTILKKKLKTFINFKDLNFKATTLNLTNLSEDILFDLAAEKNSLKKIFDFHKNGSVTTTYSSKKESELLVNGYTKTSSITFDSLCQIHSDQMKFYCDILLNKLSNISLDCAYYLRKTDNIDFGKLREFLDHISITNLSRKAGAEISAKRPLTKGIFSEMLEFAFDKLEKEGTTIKQGYRKLINLKNIYPEEYEMLWQIAAYKQNDLYNEYFSIKRFGII